MRRLLAVALSVPALTACATASAHQGDPNFRSDVLAVAPAIDGIDVEVLNRDDRLLLTNRSGRTVLIDGYSDDPYARLLPDGTVQVNRDSAATYLNEERDGIVTVPDDADGEGPPRWETVSKTGRFEWHDHRMHWMGGGVPPAVEDESRTQKIGDWEVPIAIGGERGAISGELWWTPQDDPGPPVAAIVAFVVVVLAGGAAVVVVRRRRRARPAAEAW